MTDKPYTQKEVDDIQRLAQAAALKEGLTTFLRAYREAQADGCDSNGAKDCAIKTVEELIKSDQPLLAQHDAALRDDYNKKLVECSRQIHAAIQQASVREAELRAEAAALKEAAELLKRQAEAYGIEHGQVDPTTGVWEATELEMQYCETLEVAAQDILALSDQPLLAEFETRLRAESAAVMEKMAEYIETNFWSITDNKMMGREKRESHYADALRKLIPIPYADALAEELAKARDIAIRELLDAVDKTSLRGATKNEIHYLAKSLRSAVHRAAPDANVKAPTCPKCGMYHHFTNVCPPAPDAKETP